MSEEEKGREGRRHEGDLGRREKEKGAGEEPYFLVVFEIILNFYLALNDVN